MRVSLYTDDQHGYIFDFGGEDEGEGGLSEVVDGVGVHGGGLDHFGGGVLYFFEYVIEEGFHLLSVFALPHV